MNLKFTKMQGLGNDYIYVNCFDNDVKNQIQDPANLSIKLSDRHFGVGSDGLILILPSKKCDARMRMFNSDGSEGKMCGNGIRCVGKFVYDYIFNKDKNKSSLTIETLSGIKSVNILNDDLISVDMGKPSLKASQIPVNLAEDIVVNRKVSMNDNNDYYITCVSMGNPHCIIFYDDDLEKLDIREIGKEFERSSLFPEGVNIEFVKIISNDSIRMRVWERGSGETLACGTGACASVVACIENGYFSKGMDIKVILNGGTLYVNYDENDNIYMTGEAKKVFDGIVNIDIERI